MISQDQHRFSERLFDPELEFSTSRSSGPGGQNVNKVNTKVELRFNIIASILLSDDEKDLLMEKLKNRINSLGKLIIVSQEERSQLKNKENAIRKFYQLIQKTLIPPKSRKPTGPTLASRHRRLEEKRKLSEKKQDRKSPGIIN
jgi:ribosome-associated protein